MKKHQPARLDRLTLNRETLHLLDTTRLDGARGGRATNPGGSCFPVVCFTTTVASSCC